MDIAPPNADCTIHRIACKVRTAKVLAARDRLGHQGNALAVNIVSEFLHVDDEVVDSDATLELTRSLALQLDRDANQPEAWIELFALLPELEARARVSENVSDCGISAIGFH